MTEYVPAVVTEIHCVVAPVLQAYELAPATEHNCVDPPLHIELVPEIGAVAVVTTMLHVLVQPPTAVTVTRYVPGIVTEIH